MNFARVTWFCPSGLPWLFSGLSSQVTISGMTITRGESNSDPQFHVMVSSIQAVRRGESLHPKTCEVGCFWTWQYVWKIFPWTYFFTKLIPTFFCFFFLSGFNHYRPPITCPFPACSILNSGPLEIHEAPKTVMTWKCQGWDELYGESVQG